MAAAPAAAEPEAAARMAEAVDAIGSLGDVQPLLRDMCSQVEGKADRCAEWVAGVAWGGWRPAGGKQAASANGAGGCRP